MEETLKKRKDIHKMENKVKWMDENNKKKNIVIFGLEVVRFISFLDC
jgi:hypothetical protein